MRQDGNPAVTLRNEEILRLKLEGWDFLQPQWFGQLLETLGFANRLDLISVNIFGRGGTSCTMSMKRLRLLAVLDGKYFDNISVLYHVYAHVQTLL